MKLAQLHDRLYEVLCTVDDICRKEKVRYFLDGGTEIGAVREKDFIPWDDDLDIAVLWEDYPAFKAAMEKNLPEHYHMIEAEAFQPTFYDVINRIYDDRYMVRRPSEENDYYRNLQNHIGTDVFIYGRFPENPIQQKILVMGLKILYGMGMAHRWRVDLKKYTPLERLQVIVLRILGKPWKAETIIRAYWRWAGWFHRRSAQSPLCYMVNNLPKYIGNPVMRHEWFESTWDGEIRGRRFPVTGNYDAKLTAVYGDYMKPPKDLNDYERHLDEDELPQSVEMFEQKNDKEERGEKEA